MNERERKALHKNAKKRRTKKKLGKREENDVECNDN